MPPSPAAKNTSGMSFMPKGSSLSVNVRRVKEETPQADSHFMNRNFIPRDDFNESTTSDEGSKYSYEDSGDDMDDDLNEKNLYRNAGSILSPAHSTYESPDALDINSLVQLGSKLTPGRDLSVKSSPLLTLREKEAPSLNLRKMGQPTSLKPLQAAPKKKASPKKKSKNLKSTNAPKYDIESEKTTEAMEEQKMMFESIRKEWTTMQEEIEKEEKAKYEEMVRECSRKLEDEESLMRKQHLDHLSKLRSELEKKIEEEQNAAEKNLIEFQKSNQLLYSKEEQAFRQKLDVLTEEKNTEFNKMKEEKEKEIAEKKMQLDDEISKEIENLKNVQQTKLKELKESHSVELDLVEKAHLEKINEVKERQLIDPKASQLETNGHELEEKLTEIQRLSDELSNLEDKIKIKNDILLKLEEKVSASQTYYEEIQDEVDKTENDLDLLRTEKSTLISELSILKENIKNEKDNFKSIHCKPVETTLPVKVRCENKAINTEVIIRTLCQSIQTYIDFKDAFCQISEIIPIKHDMQSQTSDDKVNTFDISCQTDSIEDLNLNNKNISSSKCPSSDVGEISDISVLINKSLENALSNITNKMDERFKVIEKHIGSLSQGENVLDNASTSNTFNISRTNQNPETQVTSNMFDLNVLHRTNVNDTFVLDASSHNPANSSHKSCSCVQGDSDSCDIMQDVKNSIYRLNDILGQTFMPTLTNSNISSRLNQSVVTYTSPFDTFYTQFRQLQEKHRITNLKHKCQKEVKKQLKGPMASDGNQLKNLFKTKDYSKPNNIENSNLYAIDYPEDALMRARNLVLTEKAKSWKQKQLQNSLTQTFTPSEHNYSLYDNVSHSVSSRTSPGLSEISPSTHYPFLNFESDPESDYNSWMLRLNNLQQKIRSHKFV